MRRRVVDDLGYSVGEGVVLDLLLEFVTSQTGKLPFGYPQTGSETPEPVRASLRGLLTVEIWENTFRLSHN